MLHVFALAESINLFFPCFRPFVLFFIAWPVSFALFGFTFLCFLIIALWLAYQSASSTDSWVADEMRGKKKEIGGQPAW